MKDVKKNKKIYSHELSCQLIGTGRAGRALSLAMARAGYRFTWVGSKHPAHAARLAEQLGVRAYGVGFVRFPRPAGFLIIAVPDGEIAGVGSDAVAAGVVGEDTIAAHLSGALGSEVLGELRTYGAKVMAFHPSQSFTPLSDPDSVFSGICFDMEGDDTACELGKCIAEDLGAEAVQLNPEQRIISHIAMTVASNYTVSVVRMAEEIILSADIPAETAQKMLMPLFLNTVQNISAYGTLKALTGPVSRGDSTIIQQHLAVLSSLGDEYRGLYSGLARIALRIAVERGDVTEERAEEIRNMLDNIYNL